MKKKILFIHGPLGGGGAERVLIDLLTNFDYSKYEVDLCLMMAEGRLLPEVPKEVRIIELWHGYTLGYKLSYRASLIGFDFMFKHVLKNKIKDKYDTIISFLEGMPLKIHSMIHSNAVNITWVHCDLEKFPYEIRNFRTGEELTAYEKMDKIVFVSNDSRSAFIRRFGTHHPEKIVIFNPVDKDKIIRMGNEFIPEKKGFTIVTVGRLTAPKKMDRIMRLARRFIDEGIDVHFQIIGDGELKSELLKQREELGVQNRVELLGFQVNPFPYVKQSDMMFCCSGYEGFCLVICEAMCLGTPVISTKTSGPIEIIDNNKYGVLTEHDDESMYCAIKKMITESELRAKYRQKGNERIDLFAVQKILKQIEEIL